MLTSLVGAQVTRMTVNGKTDPDNTKTSVFLAAGETLTVNISNSAQAAKPYAIFAAFNKNGATSGWYLAASNVDPFPVFTGIATPKVEAAFGVTINPVRVGSPFIRLNGSGQANLQFVVPKSAIGVTFFVQAVVDPDPTNPAGALDVSNAAVIQVLDNSREGSLLISHGASVDAVEFGKLDFFFSDPPPPSQQVTRPQPPPPTGFTTRYRRGVADGVALTSIDVQKISLNGIQQFVPHNYAETDVYTKRPNDVSAFAADAPSLLMENPSFPRVVLPAAGSVPVRELLRCTDNLSGEAFFLLINRGKNPNTAGQNFFSLTRLTDPLGGNRWSNQIGVSRNGRRMAAVYHDSVQGDRIFLFATDGTSPFNGSRSIELTPAGPVTIDAASVRLTLNHVFFVSDDGLDNGDGDGRNNRLFTAPTNTPDPSTGLTAVTVPATGPSANPGPVPDYIPGKSLVLSSSGTVLVFIAGDTAGTVPVDNASLADWYSVTDTSPQAAVNITEFPPLTNNITSARLSLPGNAYNGRSGFASLSPDGTRFAFVANHDYDRVAQEDDEVYLVATDGSSVGSILEDRLTPLATFNGRQNTELDNAQDLCMVNNATLLFWFGRNTNGHAATANREMDLYKWDDVNDIMVNLTGTSGEINPQYFNFGLLQPEGYVVSPNGQFYYFAYEAADPLTPDLVNLAGLNVQTGTLFNVTGNDFAGSFPQVDTSNIGALGDNYNWHLVRGGGQFRSTAYFAASDYAFVPVAQNLFLFDLDFPFVAIKMTSNTAGSTDVRSLTPNPFELGCGFSWANRNTGLGDVFYLDLMFGVIDNLTEVGTEILPLSGISFVPPGIVQGRAVTPGLIYAMGTNNVENPTDGVFTYVPLDESTVTAEQFPLVNGNVPPSVIQVYHSSVE